MTEHGLPIVDAAPACPFVAFADDRDNRSDEPDHRHRCYAEIRPAPRPLAHQESYCLSSTFPACPTFQDWARREAARPRPASHAESAGRWATPIDSTARDASRDQADRPAVQPSPETGRQDALVSGSGAA